MPRPTPFSPAFQNELRDALAIDPTGTADDLSNLVIDLSHQRLLIPAPESEPVLNDSELRHLERVAEDTWMSARAVWRLLRDPSPYAHQTAINLGRQLSARYRRQRRQGPTRMYWITAPAIVTPKA